MSKKYKIIFTDWCLNLNKKLGLTIFLLFFAFCSYSQKKNDHCIYIYGDTLTKAVENCMPMEIFERIYLNQHLFVEKRHCFYSEWLEGDRPEKKYKVIVDTFLIKNKKQYKIENGVKKAFYISFNPHKIKPIGEIKKGFVTLEYLKQNNKLLAVIQPVTNIGEYQYFFDPKFGIVAVKGYTPNTFRITPCPINWLKEISETEMSEWVKNYKN